MMKADKISKTVQKSVKLPKQSKTAKHKRMPQYQHPIEVEYWYILPTIRRELSIYLKKTGNLKQREISRVLGVSESAISQYLNGTRAVLELLTEDSTSIPNWLTKAIQDAGNRILKNLDDISIPLYEINYIMNVIRKDPKLFLCKICQQFGTADNDCEVCITH